MRLQLEGTSLSDLQAQVLAEHGTTATIVKVEKVTVGGIRGFFARKHYELIVEITQQPDARQDPLQTPRRRGPPSPAGMRYFRTRSPTRCSTSRPEWASPRCWNRQKRTKATSTASAIRPRRSAGERPAGSVAAGSASADGVSTRSDTFAGILADLASMTAEPVPKVVTPDSPRPLRGAGDLVVVVGMGEDPYVVADTLANTAGARTVSVAGDLSIVGAPRVDDRRAALAATGAGCPVRSQRVRRTGPGGWFARRFGASRPRRRDRKDAPGSGVGGGGRRAPAGRHRGVDAGDRVGGVGGCRGNGRGSTPPSVEWAGVGAHAESRGEDPHRRRYRHHRARRAA